MLKKYFFLLLFWLPIQLFAAKPITVILDWYPNPDHAALLYADAAGYFTREGLHVKLIAPTDPSIGIKLVAARQADFAVTYQPSYVLANRQGLDVTWMATLVAQPLDSMLVLDNGKINQLSDLKGKTIGYSTPGVDQLMVQLMLQHVHVSMADVKLMNIPNGLAASLMNGQVNAMQGAMRNVEPFIFAAKGIKVKQFFPEDYGFPQYDELILISSAKKANTQQDLRFIQALTDATVALQANPTTAWQMVIKKYPELNTKVNQQSWQVTVPLLDATPGVYNAKRYRDFEKFMNTQSHGQYFYQ